MRASPHTGPFQSSTDPPLSAHALSPQKTYHMIDTCEPAVASWSEDGETFVVKDTDLFASTIIPQFFKHSKWSSFVRQLNFYGFRKIKYSDSIRIDPKLEAETANYWRFRHDKFQRGRPDLLTEIKRHNSQQQQGPGQGQTGAAGGQGQAVVSAGAAGVGRAEAGPDAGSPEIKSEVKQLKDELATMTKNMEALTSLVHNMAVQDESGRVDLGARPGSKRKKSVGSDREKDQEKPQGGGASPAVAVAEPQPLKADDVPMDEVDEATPDSALSSATGGEGMDFSPMSMFPSPVPSRQSSLIEEGPAGPDADVAFVDDLFHAFEDDVFLDLTGEGIAVPAVPEPIVSGGPLAPQAAMGDLKPLSEDGESDASDAGRDHADPALMKKLSDALALLPVEMQEMLVNRLILTITSTESLRSHLHAVTQTPAKTVLVENDDASSVEGSAAPSVASSAAGTPMTTRRRSRRQRKLDHDGTETEMEMSCAVPSPASAVRPEHNPDIALPLAVATLNALLQQYSEEMIKASKKESAGKQAASKTLPVITVH